MSSKRRSSWKARLRRFPKELVPIYATPVPNESIVLYEGPVQIRLGQKIFRVQGSVRQRWMPEPELRFETAEVPPLGLVHEATIRLVDRGWTGRLLITSIGKGVHGLLEGNSWRGYRPRSRSRSLYSATFHLPNGIAFHGEPVRTDRGWRAARLTFEADGWRVLLDAVADHRDLWAKLSNTGGFALTHVGRIERADGSPFNPEALEEPLTALYWCFTFLFGRRTGPLLLVGHAKSGRPIWDAWPQDRCAPWDLTTSWAPRIETGDLAGLFRGFLERLRLDPWREDFTLAVHWYVETLHQAGAIQGGIVMAQIAFELLWWVTFVAESSTVHEPERIIAADKLRLLLERHKIPRSIPDGLPALKKAAIENKWEDGPAAITGMRNNVIHSAKGRTRKRVADELFVWEGLQLGTWYLEMLLLALVGYNGMYLPRCRQGGWASDTAKVPWASD